METQLALDSGTDESSLLVPCSSCFRVRVRFVEVEAIIIKKEQLDAVN